MTEVSYGKITKLVSIRKQRWYSGMSILGLGLKAKFLGLGIVLGLTLWSWPWMLWPWHIITRHLPWYINNAIAYNDS